MINLNQKKKIYSIFVIAFIFSIFTFVFYTIYRSMINTNGETVNLNNLREHIEKQEQNTTAPFIPIVVQNVLSPTEIDRIQNAVHFSDSQTIGASKNESNTTHRISQTGWYNNRELIDKLVHAIDPKKDYRSCEQIQVVKYTKGGFFNPHQDSIHNPHNNYNIDFKIGGHRDYTLLISLSDPNDYEGGHTVFPNLNKKYKLKKGNGLLFRNIDINGNIRDEYLHGGNPVDSGTKIICNLWTHVTPYK